MAEFFDVTEALVGLVKDLGGSKTVGPALWPDLPPLNAQRRLLDALNPERPNHLTPEQVVWLLRQGQAAGHHACLQALCEGLHYSRPVPVAPRDEAAELQRQMAAMLSTVQQLAERFERVMGPGDLPAMRSPQGGR